VIARAQWSSERLRRSSVASVLQDLDGVRLRPVTLVDAKKKVIDDDFVFVDVERWWPLDEGATWERPTWKRPPPSRIFRLAEAPGAVLIDEPLADALEVATKGLVGRLLDGTRVLTRHVLFPDPFTPPDPEPAAARAFYAGDRAATLESPRYATWLAHCVDRKPRPDTRAAAARDPLWAIIYAILVEKKPTAAALKLAAKDGSAAWLYANYVLHALPPSLHPILLADGWKPKDIRDEEKKLDKIRAFLSPD